MTAIDFFYWVTTSIALGFNLFVLVLALTYALLMIKLVFLEDIAAN